MRAMLVAFLLLFGPLLAPASAQEKPQDKPPHAADDDPSSQMAKEMVKVLKDELDLSEDQVDRATTVIQDGMREGMKRMMKHMAEEEPDQEAMRKEGEQMKEQILGKLRAVLDDEQKKEFEVLVKEFDQRAGRFERGRGLPGGEASLWLEGELASKERLLLKAENVLLLSSDEKKVVLPKVDAVITAREKIREVRREQRTSLSKAVRGKAKEDEVRERLHALRNQLAELEKDLAKAEDELRELVTIDQEARLVAIGILD